MSFLSLLKLNSITEFQKFYYAVVVKMSILWKIERWNVLSEKVHKAMRATLVICCLEHAGTPTKMSNPGLTSKKSSKNCNQMMNAEHIIYLWLKICGLWLYFSFYFFHFFVFFCEHGHRLSEQIWQVTHFRQIIFNSPYLFLSLSNSCISQLAIQFSLRLKVLGLINCHPGFTQNEWRDEPRNDLLWHKEGDAEWRKEVTWRNDCKEI